ncbi:MAG TPA: hypothetical protein VJO35_15735 [Terriglobales bacterium]|nr:hypothetical protein [Terriglobales bacterium]
MFQKQSLSFSKYLLTFIILALSLTARATESRTTPQTWTFAVSGDSRNCGDVVMPAIAADAQKHNVAFYWHLGDLRLISSPDQDFIQEHAREGKPIDLAMYEDTAWDDFIANQIKAWGDTPFFLGIGNHEVTPPKTRAAFVTQFRQYLDIPPLRQQRLQDDPQATEPRTYYHWLSDGIDFIYLDNSVGSEFDAAQMRWIEGVLKQDEGDAAIHTLVVGMHEALPESISSNHSMDESPAGIETGRKVYHLLLKMQNDAHKTVYVLASHSHYYMDGIFNTPYWKANGGVLPGWIVGTAGAERYPLPPNARDAKAAKTNIYGYLLATVSASGETLGKMKIKFEFKELGEDKIPANIVERFTKPFVHQCFIGNRRLVPIQ